MTGDAPYLKLEVFVMRDGEAAGDSDISFIGAGVCLSTASCATVSDHDPGRPALGRHEAQGVQGKAGKACDAGLDS